MWTWTVASGHKANVPVRLRSPQLPNGIAVALVAYAIGIHMYSRCVCIIFKIRILI
jgi:hypothetical protein